MDTNTIGMSIFHFTSWHTAERPTPLQDSHPITYGQAMTFADKLTSATPYRTSAKLNHPWRGPVAVLDVLAPASFLLRYAIRTKSPPFFAHFS
ncbi:unnamed protein product [Schistocephalus solidus]|uniref:Uncharacterized protein n=1 Tax=Schistocephalus solidus TaxID=70667 RepID=A0A183S910_SCHSO|nr:unnamed protein product [Schistocephalus solidus]